MLQNECSAPHFEGRFFGTDGFRGRAGEFVTAERAFEIGRFIGNFYSSELSGCKSKDHRPRIAIGKDTRRSSYMLEYALAAGITSTGADAYMLHVITTPGVAYVTRLEGFDCGIMISASHNPFEDNGIKLIDRRGEKMCRRTLAYVESHLSHESVLPISAASGSDIGAVIDHSAGRNRYIAYLISLAAHSYKGLRIGLDCSNGAAWMIAPAVFGALGAAASVINASPNGTNINLGAGSTHIEALRAHVLKEHLDIGFAFDGDGDRLIAVDEKGGEIDGDAILYVLGGRLARTDCLGGGQVVSTVMSNSGLGLSLSRCGIGNLVSAVGDQNVYDMMCANDCMLGGEQSGHVILRKYATTGDGILTALMLLEEMCDRKLPLSALCDGLELFPQIQKSIRVSDKEAAASDEDVAQAVCTINASLGGEGRILVRKSGTEPVIRVMAEAREEEKCREYIAAIDEILHRKGHAI